MLRGPKRGSQSAFPPDRPSEQTPGPCLGPAEPEALNVGSGSWVLTGPLDDSDVVLELKSRGHRLLGMVSSFCY